jgi:single-stranded-DNA-specific exonuclease
VIAFADGGDGTIKGSARSIPGLHMRDTLDRIDTQHPGLIKKFGGHAMAAGLTIDESEFERFARLFDTQVREAVSDDDLKGVLLSDGELSSRDLSIETAELIQAGGPWGQGFPEPQFDGTFKVLQQKLVGSKHLKLMVEHPDGGAMIDAIAFNIDVRRWPDPSVKQMRLVYRLDINEFRGNRSAQLIVSHLESA